MWTTREVAKFSHPETPNTVSIEIVKELNQESLDGITEWSHCWLVTLTTDGTLQMHAFEIRNRDGRKLILHPIQSFSQYGSAIIDIKPIHACDITS